MDWTWTWTWTLSPAMLNGLLGFLQGSELALLAALHALGLVPDIDGQPAWPFASRIAGEMLVMDAGHARSVVVSAICLALAVLLLAVSLFWRRARPGFCSLAIGALLLAPWPQLDLLLTQATPTSFHAAASEFTAAGIVRGQQTYQQHCLRCHGADGRGEGPDAPGLAMWPPTLNGALLWKRMEGELFWRVRHGLQGRDGRQTMPDFAQQLSAAQTWEVLDFLQAQAAGQTLKESGVWAHPVRMPDAPVRCLRANGATVRSLAGQRLRVVVPVAGAPALLDDPRLVGLQLRVPKLLLSGVEHALPDPECDMSEPAMAASLSLILGVPVEQLPGYQIMVDRQGWLRAVGQPGKSGWSEDDLVCRPGDKLAPRAAGPAAEGLDGLIGRMDGEPVRLVRGGFPH